MTSKIQAHGSSGIAMPRLRSCRSVRRMPSPHAARYGPIVGPEGTRAKALEVCSGLAFDPFGLRDPLSRAAAHSTVNCVGKQLARGGQLILSPQQMAKGFHGNTLGVPALLFRLWQELCRPSIQGWHTQLIQSNHSPHLILI